MNVKLPLFTIVLCAVNAILVSLVALQLLNGSQQDELTTAQSEDALILPTPHGVPVSPSFDAIQAQAIFHKSRSFYVAPPTPVVEQAPPDYRLVGSMSIPNQPAAAVLLNNQTNARMKVVVGDQLDGWVVAEVGPKRIVVQLGERSAEIGTTTRAQSSGMTITSAGQAAVPPPPTGVVRVLGMPGALPSTSPRTESASNEAPRLYRPPARQ